MHTPSIVKPVTLSTWDDVVKALDYFLGQHWVFRGQEDASWSLQTSIERQFTRPRKPTEEDAVQRFFRMAPRWLPTHLVPSDYDFAAWLGLIQHYGGATRLLDVTRS